MKKQIFCTIAFTILLTTSVPIVHHNGIFMKTTEYDVETQNKQVATVLINKTINGFPIDTNHIVVEYKCKFWNGWYYPVSDTSSDSQYFYVIETSNTSWNVVIKFNHNVSSAIKIFTYPGSYEVLGT